MYCLKFRPNTGFKLVPHLATKSTRGMCPVCQEIRKKPAHELEALAHREREERKKKI
jgi:hypothetical protein